jgi:hypothetical protein
VGLRRTHAARLPWQRTRRSGAPPNGSAAIWLMNGTPIPASSFGRVGNNWAIQLTGDFSGDGNSDILRALPMAPSKYGS